MAANCGAEYHQPPASWGKVTGTCAYPASQVVEAIPSSSRIGISAQPKRKPPPFAPGACLGNLPNLKAR